MDSQKLLQSDKQIKIQKDGQIEKLRESLQ